MVIDLTDLVGDRRELRIAGDALEYARRPAADAFVIAVGDRQVDAGVAVGGRAEDQAFLADADAPAVVVSAAGELEPGAVPLEAVKALAELVGFAAHGAAEAGVADHPPVPVVQAV